MGERYRLEFTDRARLDFLQARRWLTQRGSSPRAQLRLARINRAIIELEFAPYRWPVSRSPDLRVRLTEGYSVIYSVDERERAILVRRVFGPHQDRSTL